LAKENAKIVGVTPAMASGCSMDIMMKEFPDRTFDVGIANNMPLLFLPEWPQTDISLFVISILPSYNVAMIRLSMM
jgi:hypothetical protein